MRHLINLCQTSFKVSRSFKQLTFLDKQKSIRPPSWRAYVIIAVCLSCLSVCLSVCLTVRKQYNSKSYGRILTKFEYN